jgi:uncharacterized Ntn-hydrolase superfamily protein
MDAKGHVVGDGWVVAGNWLAGEAVLAALAEAMRAEGEGDLDRRLLDALAAGVAAGGDARGVLSAAIRVVSPVAPPLDLRVDHDPEAPLERLCALHEMATSPPYSDWSASVPTLVEPHRC